MSNTLERPSIKIIEIRWKAKWKVKGELVEVRELGEEVDMGRLGVASRDFLVD